MARQRRTLEEQIAELTTRGRSERAQIMATPAMAPVGSDMIEDEAIQSGHVSNGAIGDIHIQDNAILNQHLGENAVAMENLDETLKGTLASLAGNEAILAEAQGGLEAANTRINSLFEEVEVTIPKAITDQATKALNDAKSDAATKANNAVSTALAAASRGTNVVVNGSFEQDFTGWDKEVTDSTNYGIDKTVFRTGTRSFYTTKNGGFRQGAIPAKAGDTWEYSLWFKTDDQYTSSNAGGLRLQAKGADGDTWKDVASTTLKASPTDWMQSTTRYVVPADITQIRARFAFNYTGGAKVWVDDISLVNITAELAAAADAKAKADKALADAKADATAKADKAQAAAITAAAADAKAQAEAAEARAAETAAADAKKKADAAQAAALAAAKTYADAEASGAGADALAAAKADATAKADAAKAAAITAAAADATAKKEQAEATAAADAKAKADKALADAKSDATTKANAAKAAAITAAATDAAAKADAAVQAAEKTTITKMNEVANSKNATFYGTAVPTATAPKGGLAGDTYRRRDSSGRIIGEYEWVVNASGVGTWTERKLTSSAMTAVDVGVLTAGSAVIDDAVARTIAAGTADIQKANIKNLVVTDDANLGDAVARRIAANTGKFIELSTDQLTAGEAKLGQTITDKLYGEVVESRLMKASQMEIGGVNNYASISSVVDLWDYKTAHSTVVNTSYASSTQGRALRFQSNAGITSIYSKRFVVTPGESLSVEATFRNDGGVDVVGEMTLGLQYQDATGATLAWDIYATTTKAKHTHATREYQKGTSVVPAGAAYARVIASTRAIADATKVDKAIYGYIIDPIVRTNVNAELVVDGSIKARHMAIVGDNLIADSKFLNADMNAERISSSTFAAGTASFVKDDVSASNVFRLTEHSASNRSLNLMGSAQNARIPVRKGDVLKFEVWYRVRGNAVADVTDKSQIRFAIYQDAPTGAYIRYVGVGSYEAITKAGSAWYVHRSEYTITQDDVGFIRPQVQLRNPAYSGEMEFKWPSMVNAMSSGKLESNLVLASKITAGDPTGTRAEMSPDGFRVYAKPPDDPKAAATEVVRMGVASTDDYFAVTKADGTLAATISQEGGVSATSVNADESLYYRGEELGDIIKRLPRGVVARGHVDFGPRLDAKNLAIGSNSWYGVMTTSFIPEINRVYNIHMTLPMTAPLAGGESQWQFRLRWVAADDTTPPTIANTYLHQGFIRTFSGAGSWENDVLSTYVETGTDRPGQRLQVLVVAWCGPSTNTGWFRIFQWANMTISDAGGLPEPTVTYHTSAGGSQYSAPVTPPAPVKQTYTKTWTASAIKNYQGNGNDYPINNGKIYQGLSPAGYGNLSSCAVFPDMTGALSGATINKIRVYLYFEHWYYNAGGTARIGLIGKSIPATFKAGGLATSSGGWPKPGGRWVDIPSNLWNGFKTGQWGGLSLNGDGGYGTYGYASGNPKIEITYSK